MRTKFMFLFFKSPFENLRRHAEVVVSCSSLFEEAFNAHLKEDFATFEALTDKVAELESKADAIKRNIRGHMPKGVLMPVDKFQFFMYLREQDKVLDSIEAALFWLSYRNVKIESQFAEDFEFLVRLTKKAIDMMLPMMDLAVDYFKTGLKEPRTKLKSIIRDIRQVEHEVDQLERELIKGIFQSAGDPVYLFHMIRLIETISSITDHAQNASDMMRAMIAE
ncbi:MAG: TIGR00153 family protein [Desulfatiglandales bacterium]